MKTHLEGPIESQMSTLACLFDHYYERVEIFNGPFLKQAIPLAGFPVTLQD